MAAILHHRSDLEARAVPVVDAPSRQRPRPTHLRVIEGGRASLDRRAVYRRRRIAAAIVLLAVLVLVGFGVGAVADALQGHPAAIPAAATAGLTTTPDGEVVVQPGDTLWSIARRLQPTGDVRPLVRRLQLLHGPGPLQAGDRLAVAAG